MILAATLRGFVLGLPAAVNPGPLQAYLLALTMRLGWRRALPAALAPLLSDGPIILITLLVMTRLPAGFLRVVQVVGGLLLLWMAYGALQAWRSADFSAPAPETGQRGILQAALVNTLNPNAWIFWFLLGGPMLLESWRSTPAAGIGFLAAFFGALVGGFVLLVLLFGLAAGLGPRVARGLTGFSAAALAIFGLFQLGAGILD